MMSRSFILPVFLAACALSFVAGCSKQNTAPTIADDEVVGTWIEDRSVKDETGGMRTVQTEPATKELKQLTFNEDGTYKIVPAKSDGTALGDKGLVGTWKYDKSQVFFTGVTQNDLTGKMEKWVPDEYLGVIEVNGQKVMRVFHQDGTTVSYRRKS